MRVPALTLMGLLLTSPASSSTPASWAASAKAGQAACRTAAGLLWPRVSATILFSDAIGRDAMLVSGTYPQPRMKRATGTMLCLYDRRRRTAEVSEAKGWSAP